jgi:hypothetical protein
MQPSALRYLWIPANAKKNKEYKMYIPEGKFLVAKFEFGVIFGMGLEKDCHKVEVTLNLEL